MGARRRCCCDCRIAIDDFNRDNATDMGVNWPEEYQTGDWQIDGNEAIEYDGAGRTRYKQRHPVPHESSVVYLNTVAEQDGDIYEILINYKDANNFHLAQFEVEDRISESGYMGGYIRLYSVVGGVPGLLIEDDIGEITGTVRWFEAIIGDHTFCARVENNGALLTWELTDLISQGYYAGMGVAGRSGIRVDNWEWLEHLETKAGCPFCYCRCDDNPLQKKLTATVVDATGRMAAANGCSIDLEWVGNQEVGVLGAYGGQWYGEKTCVCDSFRIILGCSIDFSKEGFYLSPIVYCDTSPTTRYPLEESTCEPFYLRFGPIAVTGGDLVCQCGTPDEWGMYETGEYYIEITE